MFQVHYVSIHISIRVLTVEEFISVMNDILHPLQMSIQLNETGNNMIHSVHN